MKGITVFETLTDIREDYIRDAELERHFHAVLRDMGIPVLVESNGN